MLSEVLVGRLEGLQLEPLKAHLLIYQVLDARCWFLSTQAFLHGLSSWDTLGFLAEQCFSTKDMPRESTKRELQTEALSPFLI
jgi:hypothetical protein